MLELWQAHLTFALLAFILLPGVGLGRPLHALLLVLLFGISFIPVDGLPLAGYIRSFTDDLAITTLVALAFIAAVRLGLTVRLEGPCRLQLLIVMAALALFLYPATLGLSAFDPYRLGYNPRPLILFIGVLTLVLLLLRNWLGAGMLGLATLAFSLGIKPSPNYWDYLLDPLVALYCWGALLAHAARMIPRGRAAQRELKRPIPL